MKRAYEERFEIDSKKGGKKRRPLYENPDDFLAFVMDTLRLDVRSTRERTAKVEERKFDTYRVTLCDVEVAYVIGKEGEIKIRNSLEHKKQIINVSMRELSIVEFYVLRCFSI